jgi:hypothetical protein
MPCYPALALLIGSAMAIEGKWVTVGTRVLTVIVGVVALVLLTILIAVRHVPSPGDISAALSHHPGVYTLSLGHMEDLTLQSFAYLRFPLGLAAFAFSIGFVGMLVLRRRSAWLASTVMMVIFFQAARIAMVAFDPYLSSRPLTEALLHSPTGELIVDRHYYTFSSVFFYTNQRALLLNGRRLNLEYGGFAPGMSDVFIDDDRFRDLWLRPERFYIVATDPAVARLEGLVGRDQLHVVATSGGKVLLTNHSL